MLFDDYCTLLSYLNKPNSKFKFVVAAWCIIEKIFSDSERAWLIWVVYKKSRKKD